MVSLKDRMLRGGESCCSTTSRVSFIYTWARQKKQMLVQPQVFQVWQERPAPETPMPEAPLIRVLETFDLSSSNIEHFIDSKTNLKACVPNSVAGTMREHVS